MSKNTPNVWQLAVMVYQTQTAMLLTKDNAKLRRAWEASNFLKICVKWETQWGEKTKPRKVEKKK